MMCLNRQVSRIAGVPDEHYGKLLTEFQPRNEEQKKLSELVWNVIRSCQAKKRRTLVILGTVGNGKSLISCSGLNTYLNYYPYTAKYVTQEKLVGLCKGAYANGTTEDSVIESYTNRGVHLLVLDELTTRGWDERTRNIVEQIISRRHDNLVSTIIIGNLDVSTFKSMFDEHIKSRLRLGDTIIMTAPDMRQHEDFQEVKK